MQIRFHEQIDEDLFDELYCACYDRPLEDGTFGWKCEASPHGRAVAWTASEAGASKWSGVLVLYPRLFRLGDAVLRGGQIADLMVAPDARRRGLFRALMDEVWATHEQLGFDFVYAFAVSSGMSVGGFRTMPFLDEIGRAQRFVRLLHADSVLPKIAPAARRVSRPVVASALWVFNRRLRTSGAVAVDEFFSSNGDGFAIDAEWLDWRTRGVADEFRSFRWHGGGALVRISEQQAELYELRGVELSEGLPAVLRTLLDDGIVSVSMPARVTPAIAAALRANGFVDRSDEECLIAFAGVRSNDALRTALKTVPLSRADLDVP